MTVKYKSQLKLTEFLLKGALNPNFLNLTVNREKFGSRNVLATSLNLLLLKSCKNTFIFNIHSKVLLGSGVIILVLIIQFTDEFMTRLSRT